MLRGVDIDLRMSAESFNPLIEVYTRDREATEVSDDVIKHVVTIVRCLRGALDKTANEVNKRYGTGKNVRPYYPIEAEASRFESTLNSQIPGLRVTRPDIADAFKRHQPFEPGQEVLAHLPDLYKVSHHHDYVLQERRPEQRLGLFVGNMPLVTMGPQGTRIGGATLEDMFVKVGAGGSVIWCFKDPPLPVGPTLFRLHNACNAACVDIAQVAGL